MVKVFTGTDLTKVEEAITSFLSSDKKATSTSVHSYTFGAGRRMYVIAITHELKNPG